jgi:hypothetical protein
LLEGAEQNLLQFRQWAPQILRRDRGASQDRELGLQGDRIGSLANRFLHGNQGFIWCWFSLVDGAEILLDETPRCPNLQGQKQQESQACDHCPFRQRIAEDIETPLRLQVSRQMDQDQANQWQVGIADQAGGQAHEPCRIEQCGGKKHINCNRCKEYKESYRCCHELLRQSRRTCYVGLRS